MNSVLVIAVIAAFALAGCDADYCQLKSCARKGPHTMCQYPRSLGPECGRRVVTVGLSDAEKNEIVNKHNELRNYVASGRETRGAPGPQPAAKNMAQMSWDDELAEIAQRWANQCHFGHDKCRDVTQYQVGQNVGKKSTKGVKNPSTPKDIIQMWYDEVDLVNGKQISSGFQSMNKIGHYTQVVWGKTSRIGCGRVTYFESNGFEAFYLVCNYGETGNYLNTAVYEVA